MIHLYRTYELPVMFSSESTVLPGAMQSDLMVMIQEHQADFLARIGQLRHVVFSGRPRIAMEMSIQTRPVRWTTQMIRGSWGSWRGRGVSDCLPRKPGWLSSVLRGEFDVSPC